MKSKSVIEIDHLLEKLEFALAISQTNGDKIRSNQIKDQINLLVSNTKSLEIKINICRKID